MVAGDTRRFHRHTNQREHHCARDAVSQAGGPLRLLLLLLNHAAAACVVRSAELAFQAARGYIPAVCHYASYSFASHLILRTGCLKIQ